jgi:hypothetical protein
MSDSNLCKYRNAFGRPHEGLHSIRIFNIAIVDVAFTLLAAWAIGKYLCPKVSWGWFALALFLLGILLHRLFCVRTTVDRLLFPDK